MIKISSQVNVAVGSARTHISTKAKPRLASGKQAAVAGKNSSPCELLLTYTNFCWWARSLFAIELPDFLKCIYLEQQQQQVRTAQSLDWNWHRNAIS